MINYYIELNYTNGVGYCFSSSLPNKKGVICGGTGFAGRTIESAAEYITSQLPNHISNSGPIQIRTKYWKISLYEREVTSEELSTLMDRLTTARPNITFRL